MKVWNRILLQNQFLSQECRSRYRGNWALQRLILWSMIARAFTIYHNFAYNNSDGDDALTESIVLWGPAASGSRWTSAKTAVWCLHLMDSPWLNCLPNLLHSTPPIYKMLFFRRSCYSVVSIYWSTYLIECCSLLLDIFYSFQKNVLNRVSIFSLLIHDRFICSRVSVEAYVIYYNAQIL